MWYAVLVLCVVTFRCSHTDLDGWEGAKTSQTAKEPAPPLDNTVGSRPVGAYTCTASDCTSCLQNNKGCFWCASTGTCQPLDNGGVPATCLHAEWHDLIYDAGDCCTTHSGSYGECVADGRISYCAWCPATTEDKPVCTYKFTRDLSSRFCKAQPDELIQCSVYKTCRECSTSSVCGWCDLSSSCVTLKTLYIMINDTYACKKTTTNCCDDYVSCEECSKNAGAFTKQQCLWCHDEQQCKTYDGAVSVCRSVNRFGADYCADPCYSASESCSKCMQVGGCIWISAYNYSASGTLVKVDDMQPFCIRGGLNGPATRTFFYNSSNIGNYAFMPYTYYHLSCVLTASGLISTLIAMAVAAVVALIATLVTVTVIKRRRYMKMMRKALAQEQVVLTDSDDESDDEACEAFFDDVQAVPWE